MSKMEYAGTTFSKERIAQITKEVQRRTKERRDFVVDRGKLKVMMAEGRPHLLIVDKDEMFEFRRESFVQLAQTLKIRVDHLDRIEKYEQLVCDTLNTILKNEQKRHLVRLLDGQVDAILSDAYRAISNEDMLVLALTEAKAAGAEIWDLRLTRDEFRFLAVAKHISGQVMTDRTFDPGDGWKSRWYGKEGDVINAAITVSNSETGHGGANAYPAILRRVCANFCVWQDGVTQVHLGKKLKEEGEVFFSEETKKLENKLVFQKMKDAIRHTFDPVKFQAILDQINATTQRAIEKPTEAVDATITNLGLPQEYKEAVLEELLGSGDKTQYGLSNALTALVNPNSRQARQLNDDVVNLFEDAGGRVLRMNEKEFGKLLVVAE